MPTRLVSAEKKLRSWQIPEVKKEKSLGLEMTVRSEASDRSRRFEEQRILFHFMISEAGRWKVIKANKEIEYLR